MNVCGIGRLLRVVSLFVSVALLAPAMLAAQPPGSFTGLLRLGDFDAACSKDILDAKTDSMCRQAISMALGKEPMVEEVSRPEGGVTRTTKFAQPDPAKAGWLGEEACEHGQWQSCMLYVMLLERGDGVPLDRERADLLTHYACAKGHRLACQSLHQKGVMPVHNAMLPARPGWVSQRQAEQQRNSENAALVDALTRFTREQEQKQQELSPEQKLLLSQKQLEEQRQATLAAEPVSSAAAAEAALIAKCMAAAKDACHELAQGYERGKGMPRDPARATFYYEKACEAGHSAACAQRGKVPGAPAAQSASTSMGMLLGIAMAVLIGVAAVVLRRRSPGDGGGERPAPVRPAATPRSPR